MNLHKNSLLSSHYMPYVDKQKTLENKNVNILKYFEAWVNKTTLMEL
jgi:hypothetical protein